jgi:CCR4-NOT transcriptional complex subunit CAF120
MDGGRRTYYEEGPQIRTQAEAPMPGSQRQTIWTKVLDPGQPGARPQSEHAGKDTFVQLEPAETMTKAFALHGLLSVGMQDKEDRSAKRQEELARESGASLVNVPNKPPPPQSGLLGYVTAHERERKRDGGLGAALTEREREKRVAEERQRRLDEQQRQQLDQMQQGAMFNPMMNQMMMNMMMNMNMNPMMTGGGLSPMMTGGGMGGGMGGMNPMMTGGGMGMNPMMSGYGGGFSPQHMFAAQQAAQAYQQAMTAFSVAGSQVGGPGGNGAEGGPTSQANNMNMSPGMGGMLNPAMSGNMGFDPRISMFGMNNNMMGMGMGGGLGPQMTGMSNFDAMGSPGLGFANPGGGGMGMGMNASPNANELGVGAGGGFGSLGLQPPTMQHSQFPSRTSSPAGRGSPKVFPGNTPNSEYHHQQQQQHERGRPSRPATPK